MKVERKVTKKDALTEIQFFRVPASSTVLLPVEQKRNSPFCTFSDQQLPVGTRWGQGLRNACPQLPLLDLRGRSGSNVEGAFGGRIEVPGREGRDERVSEDGGVTIVAEQHCISPSVSEVRVRFPAQVGRLPARAGVCGRFADCLEVCPAETRRRVVSLPGDTSRP